MTTQSSTSTRTPKELAEATFAAINARDMAALEEAWHPEVVDDFVALRPYRGRAEVRGLFEEIFAAFPDFAIQVERVIEQGDLAAVQWRSQGTFTGGPFQGLEPNGKRVELRGVDVFECENGQIRHNTIYYDGASFARQVGMLPGQESAAEKAMLTAFNAATKVRAKLQGG